MMSQSFDGKEFRSGWKWFS